MMDDKGRKMSKLQDKMSKIQGKMSRFKGKNTSTTMGQRAPNPGAKVPANLSTAVKGNAMKRAEMEKARSPRPSMPSAGMRTTGPMDMPPKTKVSSPRPMDMPMRAPIAKSKEGMSKYGKTAGPMLAPRSKPMDSRSVSTVTKKGVPSTSGPKSQMGKMQPRAAMGMGAKGPSPMVKSAPMTQTGARANAAMGMAQKFMKKSGFKDGGMCAPKKGKK